jgi:hypothetical protein
MPIFLFDKVEYFSCNVGKIPFVFFNFWPLQGKLKTMHKIKNRAQN